MIIEYLYYMIAGNYSFNEKNKKLNSSFPLSNNNKHKKHFKEYNNITDENDFIEINKSISLSEKNREIANLKNNLTNNTFKEVNNIQNAKSVSSRERESNNNYLNKNIINSENFIVNIEDISNNEYNKNENSLSNKYNINNNKSENSLTNEYIIKNNKEYDEDIENDNHNNRIMRNLNNDYITQNNIYEINFESPNKNVNLVKKDKKKNNNDNSNSKNKNSEDIIKLYELNSTISNDIIFIFVNEKINEGLKILNLGLKYFVQNINNKQVSIYIFDMNNYTDNNKMSEGIEILMTELHLHKMVKIVLCCGDECIFPFIETLNKLSINFEKIIFCVLPFGRTNDLSFQFGFGKSNLFSNINLNTLKRIIQDVIESTSVSINLWEIKITCDKNNGGYIAINNNLEKYKIKTTTIRKGFISYFSLGYDSRIGFDMSKKKCIGCKCCNLFSFWWEGIKKSCFTKGIKLNQFLDALYYINLKKNDSMYEDNGNDDNQTIKEDNGRKITIFQTCGLNEHDNISINNSKSENRISSNDVINKKTYNKSNAIPADEIEGDEEYNKKSENIDIENEESESETEYEEVSSTLKTFKYEKIVIKGEPLGIIGQNIKYFGDGNISKWDSKKPSYGIQTYKNNKILSDSSNKYIKKVSNIYNLNIF